MKKRIQIYLPIIALLYETDRQELPIGNLLHILALLLKCSLEEAESFLQDMGSISEDDPEGETTSWIEEYLIQSRNHKTISKPKQ